MDNYGLIFNKIDWIINCIIINIMDRIINYVIINEIKFKFSIIFNSININYVGWWKFDSRWYFDFRVIIINGYKCDVVIIINGWISICNFGFYRFDFRIFIFFINNEDNRIIFFSYIFRIYLYFIINDKFRWVINDIEIVNWILNNVINKSYKRFVFCLNFFFYFICMILFFMKLFLCFIILLCLNVKIF